VRGTCHDMRGQGWGGPRVGATACHAMRASGPTGGRQGGWRQCHVMPGWHPARPWRGQPAAGGAPGHRQGRSHPQACARPGTHQRRLAVVYVSHHRHIAHQVGVGHEGGQELGGGMGRNPLKGRGFQPPRLHGRDDGHLRAHPAAAADTAESACPDTGAAGPLRPRRRRGVQAGCARRRCPPPLAQTLSFRPPYPLPVTPSAALPSCSLTCHRGRAARACVRSAARQAACSARTSSGCASSSMTSVSVSLPYTSSAEG